MSEFGYAVKPRSTANIVSVAERWLSKMGAENLMDAVPLDLVRLVDRDLERVGITVYPVSEAELPGAEAETHVGPDGRLEIWMREPFYNSLFEPDHRTVRARSTLGHELGHCILHPNEVRLGRYAPRSLALQRASRENLPAYRDSEWQAHTFAGAILAPVSTIKTLDLREPAQLAEAFAVSVPLVESHLRRCRKLL